MRRGIVWIALVVFAGPAWAADAAESKAPAAAEAPAKAEQPSPEVAQIVTKMQAFYEKTQSFDTRFEQRFQHGAMPSRLGGATAKGRMRFQKPQGKQGPRMRWDYDDGRLLLLVDDKSFTYDPDTKQVTEFRMGAANLSAAVTFLWGEGELLKEFDIQRSQRKDLASEGFALELRPKQASAFSKVFLVVEAETGLVKRSVVVQSDGSENSISFLSPKLGASSPAGDFDPARVFPKDAVRVKGPY